MTVKQLITELQACDPNSLVMYDAETSILNEALTVTDDMGDEYKDVRFSIDEVLVGEGTLRGFVYLKEEDFAE